MICGSRCISFLVPSLCLENRSRAPGGDGEKGMGKRQGICSYDSPMVGEKFSGLGSICQGQRCDEEQRFLTLGPTSLVPSHFCTELFSDLRKSLSSESLGESQEGKCNFSSLYLAWTVKSTF